MENFEVFISQCRKLRSGGRKKDGMVSSPTGVRQGCILSPLLYALFINGLVKELKKLKLGIPINSEHNISALLYADDIALLARNKYDLQKMLDVVTNYARKWRFELNAKKSEVVIFGCKSPPRNHSFRLGGNIQVAKKSKYLV